MQPWSGLAEAWRLGRLDATARRFLMAGRGASADFDASPTICACFGVKSRAIFAAIADGASSTEAVGARLNAGTNCGSCLPELRRMIAAWTQDEAHAEVQFKKFQFKECGPGQFGSLRAPGVLGL